MKIAYEQSDMIEPKTVKYNFESMEQLVIDSKISFYEMMSETKKRVPERIGTPATETKIQYKSAHGENLEKLISYLESGLNIRQSFISLGVHYYSFYEKCTNEDRNRINAAKIKGKHYDN